MKLKHFQLQVQSWMLRVFGAEVSGNRQERGFRFFEEALELVQANGMTKAQVLELVEYTYGREVGLVSKEIPQVLLTLSALASAHDVSLDYVTEKELTRIWDTNLIKKIQAKWKTKPHGSALPQSVTSPEAGQNISTPR